MTTWSEKGTKEVALNRYLNELSHVDIWGISVQAERQARANALS